MRYQLGWNTIRKGLGWSVECLLFANTAMRMGYTSVSVLGYGSELVQNDQKKIVPLSDHTKIKTDVVGTFACPSTKHSWTTKIRKRYWNWGRKSAPFCDNPANTEESRRTVCQSLDMVRNWYRRTKRKSSSSVTTRKLKQMSLGHSHVRPTSLLWQQKKAEKVLKLM